MSRRLAAYTRQVAEGAHGLLVGFVAQQLLPLDGDVARAVLCLAANPDLRSYANARAVPLPRGRTNLA